MRRLLNGRSKFLTRLFGNGQQKDQKSGDNIESPQPIIKDSFDMVVHPDPKPPKPREFTVFMAKSSHVIPSSLSFDDLAFTLSFRRNLELEEYKAQAKHFLNAGVDHYLAKIDRTMGPKFIEYLGHFYKRGDLECISW